MISARSLAAAYEAQPVIEAATLAMWRDKLDRVILSPTDLRDLLTKHYNVTPSISAVMEAVEEGSRLGAWKLIGKVGKTNYLDISQVTLSLFAEALHSQPDSTFHVIEKVGGSYLKKAIADARHEAERQAVEEAPVNSLMVGLKRLEHNQVFQRGLDATRGGVTDPKSVLIFRQSLTVSIGRSLQQSLVGLGFLSRQ